MNHIGRCSGTQGIRRYPTGINLTGAEHLCFEVLSNIHGSGRRQVVIEWNITDRLELFTGKLRQTVVMTIGCQAVNHVRYQLVHDIADNVRVFNTAKTVGGYLQLVSQVSQRVVTLLRHQNDVGIECLGDVAVQTVGVWHVTGRHQTFHDHHVAVGAGLVKQGNDLFHQHVALVVTEQVFNAVRRDWRRWLVVHNALNQPGGALRSGVAYMQLSDGLEKLDPQPQTVQRSDQTQCDGSKANTVTGWRQKKSTHIRKVPLKNSNRRGFLLLIGKLAS